MRFISSRSSVVIMYSGGELKLAENNLTTTLPHASFLKGFRRAAPWRPARSHVSCSTTADLRIWSRFITALQSCSLFVGGRTLSSLHFPGTTCSMSCVLHSFMGRLNVSDITPYSRWLIDRVSPDCSSRHRTALMLRNIPIMATFAWPQLRGLPAYFICGVAEESDADL